MTRTTHVLSFTNDAGFLAIHDLSDSELAQFDASLIAAELDGFETAFNTPPAIKLFPGILSKEFAFHVFSEMEPRSDFPLDGALAAHRGIWNLTYKPEAQVQSPSLANRARRLLNLNR